MASPAWRGLWRALARSGHPRYTTQPPPRLTPWKTAEVADGPGGHLAVQRHAISRTFDLIRATHTEKSTTRLLTDSRYTHHRPSWVHPHPRSRSFSATSNSLLQHVKADANNDLTVASPGDGGDGPGDMAMFNRFASAQPLALVAQGVANVSGDSPLDYPLVKAEDNGFIKAIMCYLLKAGADQIVPHTVIFWLLHLRAQSLKVIGDFHMLNTSNCQEWVQEHVGATFEQKLVDPAFEATKCYTENRMIRLIPKIIKIGFAAIHLMYSADPEEVNCWQIRYLTKAPQAAGVIHFDFERCFICVELPPDLGLLLDAFNRINEPDSIYGITMIKERDRVDEFSLKAKNSSILCLDGTIAEVRSGLRKVIAQLRQFCYDHGQRVDVSAMYGPGKEVYAPAGIGTFNLKVLHCKKLIDFPISTSDLYFRAFRTENGLFVLNEPSDVLWNEGHTVLDFEGSYTFGGLGGREVGETWIGVGALRHAFHVISKSKGCTDSLKQAFKIYAIHISEAARIQSVLNAVCHSMTDGGRSYLDPTEASPAPPTSAPFPETAASPGCYLISSSETETEAAPVASPPKPPPSYWIGTYGHYSEQAKMAIDKQLTNNQKHIIESKGAYQVTSLDDILEQIRILAPHVHKKGLFALPKEGKEVEYPYVLLEEWGTCKCL